VDALVARNKIINCDATTGKFYGMVRKQLKDKGRPIPENDIWIAAIALQHNLTLLTDDQHFHEVDRLKIEGW
jgi:tRNA(fMet)-specific endonuclease VapC